MKQARFYIHPDGTRFIAENDHTLTEDEKKILKLLYSAIDEYDQLDAFANEQANRFKSHLRDAQSILLSRVAQRCNHKDVR